MFIGAILLIGVLLGWGLGGGLRNLAGLRIRLWWLAPVALALQVAPVPRDGEGPGRLLPVATLLLSFLILIVVAAANWRLRGFVILGVGLGMNFAAIAANQGMPVSPAALAAVGAEDDIAILRAAPPGAKHHLQDEDSVLVPLADVIPVREPFNALVSAGDIVAYAGASLFLAAAMLGRAERRPRPPPPRGRTATPS